MKIHFFNVAQDETALSMHIYANCLTAYLQKLPDYKIEVISIKGRRYPVIKNVFSKELYYPIYAKIREGDINHVTDQSYGSLAYLLNPKKTIVTCHDLVPLEIDCLNWIHKQKYLYNVKGMLRVRNIIAVSQSTKRSIEKHFDYKGNIHVIYNGVDEIYNPIKESENMSLIRKKFNLETNKKYILHVGNSLPYKNVEMILHVLSQMKEVSLIKVGAFTRKQLRLISKLKLAEQIKFFENLEKKDLRSLYNTAEMLIFPSLWEGFGLPVLEAMACGCPVVCSKTSSLPEVGGGAPIYIDPNFAEEIKNAIKQVIEDQNLRKEMISRGVAQAGKFNWNNTAKEVIKIYKLVKEQS